MEDGEEASATFNGTDKDERLSWSHSSAYLLGWIANIFAEIPYRFLIDIQFFMAKLGYYVQGQSLQVMITITHKAKIKLMAKAMQSTSIAAKQVSPLKGFRPAIQQPLVGWHLTLVCLGKNTKVCSEDAKGGISA